MPATAPAKPEDIIAGIKSLRKNITFETGTLKALPKTRETSLALTKLDEARMWLGEELRRIGELFPDLLRDPYPTSKDPTVATIDPPAAEVAVDAQSSPESLGDAPAEDSAPETKNPNLVVPELPAVGALTDQQILILKGVLAGCVPTEPEYAAVSEICAMMVWAQAAGLRVASAEDYATARQKVDQAMGMVEKMGASTALTDLVVVLGDAKALLDAWTPPQR